MPVVASSLYLLRHRLFFLFLCFFFSRFITVTVSSRNTRIIGTRIAIQRVGQRDREKSRTVSFLLVFFTCRFITLNVISVDTVTLPH